MDTVVAFIQMVCIAGLVYGIYLTAGCPESAAPEESWRKLRRRSAAGQALPQIAVSAWPPPRRASGGA